MRLCVWSSLRSTRHHRRVEYMAASPIATSNGEEQDQTQQHILKWSAETMDVEAARDHMGPGGDIDMNGASHPADDRSAPGQEPADYPAAPGSATGSAGDAAARLEAAQRGEKLVKVLIWSLVYVLFLVSSPPPPPRSLSVALKARPPLCSPRLSAALCA